MGKVRKEAKEEIIRMMILEIPTEEIAARLNYSVGTVRQVFEELRDEFGVSSKIGIAAAYFRKEIKKLNQVAESILKITDGSCQMTPNPKTSSHDKKQQKSIKKRKK